MSALGTNASQLDRWLGAHKPCKGCGSPYRPRDNAHRYCSRACWYANGIRTWHKAGLDATLRPSTKDIAWAAGVYEGEGTCCGPSPARTSAAGDRKRRQFRVSVTQKDPWLCLRLRELFGGSVNFHQRQQAGREGQAIYHWQASGARARGFAFTIYSFLSPRRRGQIQKALAPQ